MNTIQHFRLPHSLSRLISTSATLNGKKNFRKFPLYGKRGTRVYKAQQNVNPDPEMPIYTRGVRSTGYEVNGKFIEIAEKIPQLMVPDLTKCTLKPYVAYNAPDVTQTEFTSQDLFNVIYKQKIIDDFKAGKLDAKGNALEPSAEEKLTPIAAWESARKTGSDIF